MRPKKTKTIVMCSLLLASIAGGTVMANQSVDAVVDNPDHYSKDYNYWYERRIQLGPRPEFLVNDMDSGWLKRKLASCKNKPSRKSKFSIGHRGAPLQFPEHTLESYVAGARMGAGILECDVSFTKDAELVCRHSQCDLHTTTNILATPLAKYCSEGFTPARFDADGNLVAPATAKCCTSDLTVEQFKSLQGKMDASNPRATSVAEYLGGTADWRTDLYASRGTLLTHLESIRLFDALGADFTPELKGVDAEIGFGESGLTQETYAQKMIDEYKYLGIRSKRVWAQSFNLDDVLYWINNEPKFGKQAVYLDGRYDDPSFDHTDPSTYSPSMSDLRKSGVRVVAPPMWMLVQNKSGRVAPSTYAYEAKRAGLDIITWTIERSGPLSGGGGWYYQTTSDITNNDGDMMKLLHVLAKDIGVLGVFSDWPATTTYYANCMGIK